MPDISNQLRKVIRARIKAGTTAYRIARDAGLKPEVVYRFIDDELDLRLSTAAKLAAALGLELRPKK